MADWIEIIKDNGPQIAQWAINLGLGAGGGVAVVRLALKKQRRVLANLQRPIMVIGTDGEDMQSQVELLRKVDLFTVDYHRTDKATDHLSDDHRLLILGYGNKAQFDQAFDCARTRRVPVLVYAKPDSVPKEDREKISGYSFAALCNTDLRLVSDVFAVMSTFPEK